MQEEKDEEDASRRSKTRCQKLQQTHLCHDPLVRHRDTLAKGNGESGNVAADLRPGVEALLVRHHVLVQHVDGRHPMDDMEPVVWLLAAGVSLMMQHQQGLRPSVPIWQSLRCMVLP